MPKTKKATLKAKKPLTSKKTASKRLKRPVFKFNIQEVLNNRQLEAKLLEQTPKLKDDFQITDELCQEQLDKIFDLEDDDKLPLESFDPMFFINYNIPFNDNSGSDFKKLCLQRLQIMSVEGNELRGKIQSNILMRANWSPLFDDVQNILCKWPANFDTLTNSPSSVYQMKDYKNIALHNFKFVMDFISFCILKTYNDYSFDELLKIAKYTVTIYFHLSGRMFNALQTLFSTCIETAIEEDDDLTIMAFAEELYSEHNEDELIIMMVDLFLPFDGEICKKMYTYLTYKLFKLLLGKTDITNTFPSSINDWFVLDLVDKNFFKKKPQVLSKVVQLLEHVVFIFDLYKEDKKLDFMYHFLYTAVNLSGLSDSTRLLNILDIWRLTLFRLQINRLLNV
ncbi:uncharacterized protein LOC111038114 [Myzus persicae]|uniref:uncharacterized protein LOC111038114 n=1 Tax=Myzus persicae TaxID=13164 RepID=UPI000B935C7D|nr:uncharacterized protein LOC111038114 [Myzus persicae]XP_022176749.1 uncharacterized protein LOC111038114 [Myzus persicae]